MTNFSLPPLYLVTDQSQTKGRTLPNLLEDILPEGKMMVQLREKDLEPRPLLALAQEVSQLTDRYEASFVINDRVDIAMTIGARGVHLRSTSLPIRYVRRLLTSEQIIGCSVHSVEEALYAEKEGADFIVLGPIYDTRSKRSYGPPVGLSVLEEACRRCQTPLYAIGGITASRVQEVKATGAYGVAAISALLGADDVRVAAQEFLDALLRDSQD